MPGFLGRYSSCGISFQNQNDSIAEVAQQRGVAANPGGWTIDYLIIEFQAEFTHPPWQPFGRQTVSVSAHEDIGGYPPQIARNLLREFSQQPAAAITAGHSFCLALIHAG